MTNKVTFHGHEVKSSQIFMSMTHRAELSDGPELRSLIPVISLHQTRFANNTKHTTYRDFIRNISKEKLDTYFLSCLTDRKGNDMNANKPLETREFILHKNRIKRLVKSTFEMKDLALTDSEILEIMSESFPDSWTHTLAGVKHKLLSVIQLKPDRNNKLYLGNITRGYINVIR